MVHLLLVVWTYPHSVCDGSNVDNDSFSVNRVDVYVNPVLL